ncbi:PTS sugar transporter subunit IIC [Caviibacter abscessus]|uniref:PTS sugar transporter subunit IIC n=1 Tax=Caviibacter abscessus TaxID=1766719 RepID=UPI000839AC5D|nr:PTS transporter subunit EIIC [Caviibacter abscessus]
MKNFINSKLLPIVMKFTNLKGIIALREGMSAILTITVVGSIFLLLAEFPYEPIKIFLADKGISPYLYQVFNSTFNMLSLVCSITIAYSYAKNEKIEPIGCVITSLVSFLIVSNQFIIQDDKKISGVLSLANTLGARGMIAAIIVSLMSSYLYCLFIKKKMIIKMPESVPQGVANSFSALIPGAIILSIFALVYGIINIVTSGDLVDIIYKLVQIPLLNLTDSLIGVMIIGFVVSFLWWFGIHGNNVVGGIMTGIWLSAIANNQEIINKGLVLTSENGGRIVTYQFHYLLITVTGSGITIGMVIAMLLSARSQQFKQIGRLSIVPAIFNINEPVMFGTPIVFNPILFIPFVCTPMIVSLISYLSIKSGLVPMFGGVNPPWTTPPILSGLLSGGIRTAILQIIIIAISTAIYYPFVIYLDKKALEQEKR